jgi:hypothetical protein
MIVQAHSTHTFSLLSTGKSLQTPAEPHSNVRTSLISGMLANLLGI